MKVPRYFIRGIAPVIAVIAAVVIAAHMPGAAFKTYRITGGAVHEEMTRQALADPVYPGDGLPQLEPLPNREFDPKSGKGPLGEGFSDGSLRIIDDGNTWQDGGNLVSAAVGCGGLLFPEHHFDGMKLIESLEYALHERSNVVSWAKNCYKGSGRKWEDKETQRTATRLELALFHLGQMAHTFQDFYSHSNWVELQLFRPGKVEGSGVIVPSSLDDPELPDWEKKWPLRGAESQAIRTPLKTGYFFWRGTTDNELTVLATTISTRDSWKKDCRYLIDSVCEDEKVPKDSFKSLEDFEAIFDPGEWCYRPDPRVPETVSEKGSAVTHAVETFQRVPGKAPEPYSQLHHFLCKDGPKDVQGSVRWGSWSLYEYARRLAIWDTRRQWKWIEGEIVRTYPRDFKLILAALKGFTQALYQEPSRIEGKKRWETAIDLRPRRAEYLLRITNAKNPEDVSILLSATKDVKVWLYAGDSAQMRSFSDAGKEDEGLSVGPKEVAYYWGPWNVGEVILLRVFSEGPEAALTVSIEEKKNMCVLSEKRATPEETKKESRDIPRGAGGKKSSQASSTREPSLMKLRPEAVPEVIRKRKTSFLAFRLLGSEKDFERNREIRYSGNDAFIADMEDSEVLLSLGFDGKSVNISMGETPWGLNRGRGGIFFSLAAIPRGARHILPRAS